VGDGGLRETEGAFASGTGGVVGGGAGPAEAIARRAPWRAGNGGSCGQVSRVEGRQLREREREHRLAESRCHAWNPREHASKHEAAF
jgi:hypothetical protein